MHSEAVIVLGLSALAYCDQGLQYRRQEPSQYGTGPSTYASASSASSTTSTLPYSSSASTALSSSSLPATSSTSSSSQSPSTPEAYSSPAAATTSAQTTTISSTVSLIPSTTVTTISTVVTASVYASSSTESTPEASQYSSSSSTATSNESTPSYTNQAYTYSPPVSSTYASSSQPSLPSTSITTYGPSAVGPGTAPTSGRPLPSTKTNVSCDGATLNVLGASLDWWFPETVYDIVSTYSTHTLSNGTTAWGVAPVTTPFDLTSALTTPICTFTNSFNTQLNSTFTSVGCVRVTAPTAAATTVITQTAYRTPNATTGTGTFPSVQVTPAPAAITIPTAGGNFSQGTPFVYFSAYEITSKSPTTSDGTVGCAEATHVYNMSHPFSFEYTGPNPDGELEVGRGVTGDVAPAFLSVVNQTSAAAGSWVAAPTVVLVVQKIIATKSNGQTPFVIVPSATPLQLPSPTLPGSLTPGQPQSMNSPQPVTVHLESTQPSLDLPTQTPLLPLSPESSNHHLTTLVLPTPTDVQTITTSTDGEVLTATALQPGPQSEVAQTSSVAPFVGQSGSHKVTLAVPANPSETVITASWSGGVITATRLSEPAGGNGGNGGALASAIISAAQPTNAVGVLTDALNTFNTPNPTAGAILSGIGGGVPAGNNGNNGPGNVGPIITAGGSSWTAQNTPAIVVDGQTVRPGSPAIIVDGHTVSAPASASAVVIDGSTLPFSGEGSTVLSANGVSVTEAPEPVFTIGSQTLLPGGSPIVVAGTTFSLPPEATAVVVNGQTQRFLPAVVTPAPVLTVGNTAYAPNAGSTYDIEGSMLTPGGVITVDGTTISLGPGGVVVNGVTQTMGAGNSNGNAVMTMTAPPALTIDGQTFSPNGGSSYIISGQTLTPGGVITITENGVPETISLSPGATEVVSVVSGHTVTSEIGALPSGALLTTMGTTYAGVLTIGGQTFTATESGDTYVIDGQTLTPGEQETVTIGGTTYIISLESDATVLEIETEGPNGQVTATSFETILPATATRGTVTNTVDADSTASAGAAVSSTAQATSTKGPKSSAPSVTAHLGGLVGAAITILALAICL